MSCCRHATRGIGRPAFPAQARWALTLGLLLLMPLPAAAVAPGLACDSGPGLVSWSVDQTGETASGLLWLDVPATSGWSSDDVRADGGAVLDPSWRHASGAEVCGLLADGGLAPTPCPGGATATAAGDVTASLRGFLGETIHLPPVVEGTMGAYEDGTPGPDMGYAPFWYEAAANQSLANVTDDLLSPAATSASGLPLGHYLVRRPACSDGDDDDADGLVDHPADDGCSSPFDDTEGLDWKLPNPSVAGLISFGVAVDASGQRVASINPFASFTFERVGDEWLVEYEDVGDGLGVALAGDVFVTTLNIPTFHTNVTILRHDGTGYVVETRFTSGGNTFFGNCSDCVAATEQVVIFRQDSTLARILRRDPATATWLDELSFSVPTGPIVVDVDGDVALVGAPADDEQGVGAGAVHVFRYDGTGWAAEQKLLPSAPAAGRAFGSNVALHGDVVAVGEPGRVTLFRYDGSSWGEAQSLDWTCDAAQQPVEVAVSGDLLLVANPACRGAAGAARVLLFDGAAWEPMATLTPCDGSAGEAFGEDVALSGDLAVIGAPGAPQDGATYVFDLDAAACANGVDDDGDGLVDLADGGCNGRGDRSEAGSGSACGLGPEIALLLPVLLAARRRRR